MNAMLQRILYGKQVVPEQAIRSFAKHYASNLSEGLQQIPAEKMASAASAILRALQRGKNTIYFFGNGGSCSQMKYFELLVKKMAREEGAGVRTGSVDFSEARAVEMRYGYGQIFKQKLVGECVGPDDLVVLASASGNSDNVLGVARYCREKAIPTISFSGFSGGGLATISPSSHITAPVHDQQICEDLAQFVMYLISKKIFPPATERGSKEQAVMEAIGWDSRLMEIMTGFLTHIYGHDISFLYRLASDIVDAHYGERRVYVVAPEGGLIGTSAEHTAHNLNWDAVYGIKHPPERRVLSTPTMGDYTGINNDRIDPDMVFCQQLEMMEKGSVLLLYLNTRNLSDAGRMLGIAEHRGITAHVLRASSRLDVAQIAVPYMQIGLPSHEDDDLAANVLQIVGHMLGRITRAMIKVRQGICSKADFGQVLIGEDMAQRRLREKGDVDGA